MPLIRRVSFALVFFLLAALSLAQAPDAGPYRVGGNVLRPEKISGAPPVYTEMARKARIMGVVIIEVVIDEEGDVTQTKVLKGLPMGLDKAAVDAVETWKFKPATLEGRPVPVYYVLTVNFQLDSDLSFGPLFAQLMEKDPGFRELVHGRRYEEALDLLGRRSGPEARLARSYVFQAMGRIGEAWEEAQAYDGPEPGELFHHVALAALNRQPVQAENVELGLQAVARALETRKDDPSAIRTQAGLLRQKADLTDDEEERQALLREVDELEKRAAARQPKRLSPP